MRTEDLGTMPYRDAWRYQERAHADVSAGGEERVLLVEHPPVITLGRRPGLGKNIIAPPEVLRQRGVEVVESDRGGDVTFHGPGQLVAYPIVRLNDHRLSVGAYVHLLEDLVIATLADLQVPAQKDACAVGVWVHDPTRFIAPARSPAFTPGAERSEAPDPTATCDDPARTQQALSKICAIGVRIRRGVSMHGLALNVSTDLTYFDLIIPCGLVGRSVTSLQQVLRDRAPSMDDVKRALSQRMAASLGTMVRA